MVQLKKVKCHTIDFEEGKSLPRQGSNGFLIENKIYGDI
jgi:hypothetical protein